MGYNTVAEIREDTGLEALEIARQITELAGNKQAVDILLLDVREVCNYTDYVIICSGESERQLRAIQDEVEQAMKKDGITPLHREGTFDSGWILLDYGEVVLHILSASEREYYQLDHLWSDASVMVRIQ